MLTRKMCCHVCIMDIGNFGSVPFSLKLTEGMLIANDADPARSHMLVKQTKRLNSPCLMVTNHEAQLFPSIYFAPKV